MVDWISTLPDAILSFILSFLPTKQAVATSVLSKRWKPLWRSVPTLDLDDRGFWRDKEGYARFVQGVRALFRDLHHPIQKLRLWSVSQFTDLADVSIWLNAAVQRRIQHLNLNLARRPINLSSMLSCKTLVVLKLDYIKLEPISSVDLPSLKVLQLRCLSFSELGCLVELLSGCPVLEDFTEYNLTFESDLYYDEDVTGEFKTLGKLLRANISNTNINVMLELVNNVKFLHIDSIEGFSLLGLDPYHFEAPRPYVFPMFHNLTHIELQYRNYNNDWSEALELLKYCPELQVIVIDQPNINAFAFELSEEEPKNWRYTPSFPECILLHLKECYLNDYRGTKGEFQFARHVMQNGRSLKKMTICSGDGINQQRRLELLEKLSSCTRHSATFELYFE